MWMLTDDPVMDAENYQIDLMNRPEYECPLCEWCGKPLDHAQEDYCILTDANELICLACSDAMWESKRKEWEHARMRCIPYMERTR